MTLDKKEQEIWDMYFGEIAGWTIHPGFNRENAKQPTLDECADMADEMIEIRRKRHDQSA